MKTLKPLFLIIAVAIAAGCSGGPKMETRAFEVKYLEIDRAYQLVDPYVFRERENSPGIISISGHVLTVRETVDNLTRIEAVLRQFDKKQPEITLYVDVIEADGGDVDPAISVIQIELAELFKFTGYRRAAGGVLTATEGSSVEQSMGVDRGSYVFEARCRRLTKDDGEWLLLIDLRLNQYTTDLLSTSAMIRDGQTTLVGTTLDGDVKAVILAVRLEIKE